MIFRLFNLFQTERQLQHELNENHADSIRQDILAELKKVQEQIELILESNFDSHGF